MNYVYIDYLSPYSATVNAKGIFHPNPFPFIHEEFNIYEPLLFAFITQTYQKEEKKKSSPHIMLDFFTTALCYIFYTFCT